MSYVGPYTKFDRGMNISFPKDLVGWCKSKPVWNARGLSACNIFYLNLMARWR